jgi:hypothetical protein
MGDAAGPFLGEAWEILTSVSALLARVSELSGKTYSQSSYNQRR